ncbi:hypothetical protein EV672_101135 [Aquabacterium commune]|uniref:Uncharacterized protein n=1 Tax=Aquabacterium commune TaxID=70586 RepID=A0A4R6RN34_9BURK|nr:hypothetical protein [Aquabacterium commune]TDP88000.1 hypothetical protein EV672_101135 [Aquabacterium commune]
MAIENVQPLDHELFDRLLCLMEQSSSLLDVIRLYASGDHRSNRGEVDGTAVQGSLKLVEKLLTEAKELITRLENNPDMEIPGSFGNGIDQALCVSMIIRESFITSPSSNDEIYEATLEKRVTHDAIWSLQEHVRYLNGAIAS